MALIQAQTVKQVRISPRPFQGPWNGPIRQHDSEIRISDSISSRPGKKHGGIRNRRLRDIRESIIDGPHLDRAGKNLGKGREYGGADNPCAVGQISPCLQ